MWIFKATIVSAMIAIMNGQYVTDCRVCEQLCLPTPYGNQCRCRQGFHFNPANLSDCLAVTNACQIGLYLNPVTRNCEDLNECLIRPCEQDCTNLRGSYQCSCRQGYTPNPQDTTKCIASPSVCQTGFRRNPSTGICEAGTSAATSVSTSANTADRIAVCEIGSYRNPRTGRCEAQPKTCPPGFVVNPRNTSSCADINECQTSGLCEHKCINLNGGYRCSCFSAYEVSSADRGSCDIIRKCTDPKDLIIAIDSTTSIGSTNFKLLLSFIAELVRHFEFGNSKTRFLVLLFSDRVVPLFGFDDYRTVEDVTNAILAAPYLGGDTDLGPVFDYIRAKNLFDGGSNALDEVLFFIDGPTRNPALAMSSAENIKNQGVKIVAVGITNQVPVSVLNSIVSTPGDFIYIPEGFEYLDYYQQRVDRRICPKDDD